MLCFKGTILLVFLLCVTSYSLWKQYVSRRFQLWTRTFIPLQNKEIAVHSEPHGDSISSTSSLIAKSTSLLCTNTSVIVCSDILSEQDFALYSDKSDLVIVGKRTADTVQPIRVAMLEFDIPDKLPQPKNFLENAVWQREGDIERLRESFTLSRALSIAKSAEKKYPRRDLVAAIRDRQQTPTNKPLVIVEMLRNTVHRGGYSPTDTPARTAEWQQHLAGVATQLTPCSVDSADLLMDRVVALGTNAEGNLFGGCFEDLTVLNRATTLPVIYNDLVTSVFQLLQAKIHGAHAVKFMACVLELKELNYLVKVAKSLGLSAIIVVASKPQMLRVLSEAVDFAAISVTSRNMRLWKVHPGKAEAILNDEEVRSALSVRRAQHSAPNTSSVSSVSSVSSDPGIPSSAVRLSGEFLVLQEGFASPADLITVGQRGVVDAVILGEELLPYEEGGLLSTLQEWL